MSNSRSEPVELSLVHFFSSESAYLVGDSGEREDAVWFAKSLVKVDLDEDCKMEWETRDNQKTGRAFPIRTFLVPEWLANEKGFL